MRLFISLLVTFALSAQGPPPTEATPEHLAAMKKLSFMIGEWQGESWTLMGREKQVSTGTEVVQSKLNGTILVVEGTFKDKAGKTVHNALGIFSFNPRSDLFRFHAFTAAGLMVEPKIAVKDQGFDWSFESAPGTRIQYRMQIDEKGEWVEKGEMTREGKTFQFFEMRLRRVK